MYSLKIKINKVNILHYLFILVILLISVWLRIWGLNNSDLWIDEVWRVNTSVDRNFLKLYFTNPNSFTVSLSFFYASILKIVSLIHADPITLRLSSFLPGIFIPVVFYFILHRLTKAKFYSFISAIPILLNENLIRYSNELKPYSLESLIWIIVLFKGMKFAENIQNYRIKERNFILICILAVLFASNVIFIIISIFTYIILIKPKAMLRFLKNKSNYISNSLFTVVCLSIFAPIFVYGNHGLSDYWNANFPSKNLLYFYFSKWGQMLLQFYPGTPTNFLLTIWISFFLTAFIIFFVIRRKLFLNFEMLTQYVANLLIFIFILSFLNYLGVWPLGYERFNLPIFVVIYLLFTLIIFQLNSRILITYVIMLNIFILVTSNLIVDKVYLTSLTPPNEQLSSAVDSYILGPDYDENNIIITNPGSAMGMDFLLNTSFNSNLYKDLKIIKKINSTDLEKVLIINAKNLAPKLIFIYSHWNAIEVSDFENQLYQYGYSVCNHIEFSYAGYIVFARIECA